MTAEDVLVKCGDFRRSYFLANGDWPKVIRLSMDEYLALSKYHFYPPKPVPPIKKEKTTRTWCSYSHEIERDFHAPEYLEKLKLWEIEISQLLTKKPTIFGMEIEVFE